MTHYMEATDGSSMEVKESALVWHHRDADPDFGSCQAKELLDHLENVLANEPAVVQRGQHIVEVKPQVRLSLSSLSRDHFNCYTHIIVISVGCHERFGCGESSLNDGN